MNIPFLMGAFPLVVMILAIAAFKMPVHKAVALTLVLVLGVAGFYFDTPAQTLTNSLMYGVIKGFWPIVVVIFGAIFSYNLMVKTGAINIIRNVLSSVSDDQRVLILLISWCFGGFLEAAAGFSTAVAIPLSILIALGFNPLRAAIATLVADTVSTAFGAVGIPVVVIGDALGLPTHGLASISTYDVIQTGIMNLILPFLMIVIYTGKLRAIKGMFLTTLLVGIATLIPQYVVAYFVGPELTSFGGSLVSMAVLLILVKMRGGKTPEEYRVANSNTSVKHSTGEILRAVSIYFLMFVFILATSPLFPSIRAAVGSIVTPINFTLADGKVLTAKLDWIATPGVLIFIASIIGGFLCQGAKVGMFTKTVFETVYQLRNAGFAISAIVAMATLMDVTGIIKVVAEPIVTFAGPAYPFVAPLVGAVGTFLTGSVTNANVLFGHLQATAANTLHLDPIWLAAANCAGATAAKMISPQTISIAVAAPGLAGQDGTLLKGALKWFVVYILIVMVVSGIGGHFVSGTM